NYADTLTAWLNADLTKATANRTSVPWIIAAHHEPPYSSSTHGEDSDVLRVRQFFGPIWDKYHLDLDIAGHDHDYERSRPLTGPTDNPTIKPSFTDGTAYLVCAGAGADPYPSATSTFTEISRDYQAGGAIGFYTLLKISKASL